MKIQTLIIIILAGTAAAGPIGCGTAVATCCALTYWFAAPLCLWQMSVCGGIAPPVDHCGTAGVVALLLPTP